MSSRTPALSEAALPLPARAERNLGRVVVGLLSVLAALPFLSGGTMKAIGAAPFAQGFPAMHYPLWFMHLLGVMEVSGALGLFFRRTRVLAAAGLASILFGAIATHIVAGQGVAAAAVPIGLIGLLALIVGLDAGVQFEMREAGPTGKARRVALGILVTLVGLQFAFAGALKTAGVATMVQHLGEMHYSVPFIHVLGVLELLGAVGLFVPRVRALAAFGLAAILHGAVASHVVHGDAAPNVAMVLVLIALLYVIVALDGRFTVRVDGFPVWRRILTNAR